MREWGEPDVSRWLFDACRVLPEVNTVITNEVVRRNPSRPGNALADIGFQDLRKLCEGRIKSFGEHISPVAKTYWHASAIHQEIYLRCDFPERYIQAFPYYWPYNGIIHPGNTALLVIGMQRDFMELGCYMNLVNPEWKPDTSIIGPIQSLLKKFREDGYHVMHVREGHEPNMIDLAANKYWRSRGNKAYDELPASPGIGDGFRILKNGQPTGPFSRVLTRGEPGWELIKECSPIPGETIVDKPTFGAFAHTGIELHLNTKKIQNLVITGVMTDVGVSTIMREANDRGFECILVTDATASVDPVVKQKIIESIHLSNGIFGCTTDSKSLIDCLSLKVVRTDKTYSLPRKGVDANQTDHDEITTDLFNNGMRRQTTVTVHVTTQPIYSVVRDSPVTVIL
eukprot:TRINITY_DN12250_c0_g2_i6.p1 TRINITY_DN12250_c0_g2~~TRINITY_DN12250_c0_g2_i6.p1  ORF type:complete len:398 (-),score=74.72 TRINITY_DN12250_c0_g2_i6:66-1259(-)